MSPLTVAVAVPANVAAVILLYRLFAWADERLTAVASAKIHRGAMSFWATQLVVVWLLPPPWRIPYIVTVSIYANLVGHWSGASAERPPDA